MRNLFVVIFCFIVVAATNLLPLFVPGMENVLLAGAIGLLAVTGGYTGMDFSAIAEGTRKLPRGQFIEADKNKYLGIVLSILAITVECLIVSIHSRADLENTIAMYLLSALGVAAIYVTGMKANKKATGAGPNGAPKAKFL